MGITCSRGAATGCGECAAEVVDADCGAQGGGAVGCVAWTAAAVWRGETAYQTVCRRWGSAVCASGALGWRATITVKVAIGDVDTEEVVLLRGGSVMCACL